MCRDTFISSIDWTTFQRCFSPSWLVLVELLKGLNGSDKAHLEEATRSIMNYGNDDKILGGKQGKAKVWYFISSFLNNPQSSIVRWSATITQLKHLQTAPESFPPNKTENLEMYWPRILVVIMWSVVPLWLQGMIKPYTLSDNRWANLTVNIMRVRYCDGDRLVIEWHSLAPSPIKQLKTLVSPPMIVMPL